MTDNLLNVEGEMKTCPSKSYNQTRTRDNNEMNVKAQRERESWVGKRRREWIRAGGKKEGKREREGLGFRVRLAQLKSLLKIYCTSGFSAACGGKSLEAMVFCA